MIESIAYGLRNGERLDCNHLEDSVSTFMDDLEISPSPDTEQGIVTFSRGEFNLDSSVVSFLECFH